MGDDTRIDLVAHPLPRVTTRWHQAADLAKVGAQVVRLGGDDQVELRDIPTIPE